MRIMSSLTLHNNRRPGSFTAENCVCENAKISFTNRSFLESQEKKDKIRKKKRKIEKKKGRKKRTNEYC